MSEHEHEPEATPEQLTQVRRLLAEARHDEPVPPEVGERLDDVLAQLVGRRELPGGASAPPLPTEPDPAHDELAARRRSRVRNLLVAAAAVVVLGVGIGQVVDTGLGGVDDADSSNEAPSAAGAGATERELADAAPEGSTGGSGTELDNGDSSSQYGSDEGPAPSSSEPQAAPIDATLPVVSPAAFRQSVLQLRRNEALQTVSDGLVLASELSQDPMFVCDTADWGAGSLVGVIFGRLPAVLAYREPVGDVQTVELLQCGTGDVLRSTVVPR